MTSEAGIDVVLEGLPRGAFPMTKEQVRCVVGGLELSDSMGQGITVRELLERVNEERFDSPDDVARALKMAIALETERTVPD